MHDLECPYCGEEQDVCYDEPEIYDEGIAHEMECQSCEKKFTFQTTISFHYSAFAADCLNGSDHDLRLCQHFPILLSQMKCRSCEYTRRATPEEIEKGE